MATMAGPGAPWSLAPILGVRDVRRATDSFCDVLGFTSPEHGVFEGVGGEGAVYSIVERDGVRVHLQIRRRPVFAGGRQEIEADVYVYVGDVDAVHAVVLERGARVFRGLCRQVYGMRDFVVETPDGHRILFGAPAQ